MSKVTFDGPNKLIILNTGVTTIDVEIDLYSEWKKWVLIDPNSQWAAAFRTVGGDVIGTNQFIPKYFFLINTWKVKIDNLSVNFSTNLYSDDYLNPLIITNSSVIVKNSDVPGITELSSITYNIENINSAITSINSALTNIEIDITDALGSLKSILGLSQHNYRLLNHTYDSDHRLLSCNIKLYNTSYDCDNDLNAFEVYEMDAVYNALGELVNYKVIKL